MKIKASLLGLLSLVIFSCSLTLSFANEVVINLLKGDQTEILRKGTQNWDKARNGQTLLAGDKIRTGKKSRLVLISKEGHKILIKQKTVLEMTKLGPTDWEFNEESGRTRVKVAPLGAGQSLKVNTPTAVCSVRGTEFEVAYENKRTTCDVYRGVVAFAHSFQGFAEVSVKENQRSTIDALTPPTPPQLIPEKERTEEPELADTTELKSSEEEATPMDTTIKLEIENLQSEFANETGKDLAVSSSEPR